MICLHLSLTPLPKPIVSQQSISPLLKMSQVTRLYAQWDRAEVTQTRVVCNSSVQLMTGPSDPNDL